MQKVAHYRRAIWLNQRNGVEGLVTTTLGNCPTVADTKFEYRAGVDAQISERSTVGRGIGLYITLYSEGGATGTIQNGGSRVGRANAPAGTEFLKTGIHMVIEGDHLAYLANGHTNDGQITSLIHEFLKADDVGVQDTQFQFMARPNRRELERLLRVGVKSIDLGVGAFLATAEEMQNNNQNFGLLDHGRQILGAVRGVLGRDRTPEQIEAASEVQATLHLGYDGRGASELVPQILSQIASNVAQGHDEFKIVTKDDAVITRDKLVIKREVQVDGDEISIESGSAFAKLRNCLQEWRRQGILDE